MRIKELIEKLEAFDPDLDVLMSRDEEGNGFGTLDNSPYNFYSDKKTLILFPTKNIDYEMEDQFELVEE